MKLAIKRLVLSKPSPAGCAFPSSSIIIEPPHLRLDNTRPGDIYACGRGIPQGLGDGHRDRLSYPEFVLNLLYKKLRFRPTPG